MKRFLLLIVLSGSLCSQLSSQIEVKFFPNQDALENVKTLQKRKKSSLVKKMPSFDVQQLIKEDKALEKSDVPFRFGYGFDVNFSFKDGQWQDVDNGRLWSMNFESSAAYSMNFVFEDFYLPEGAELYISNQQSTMLYGPVKSANNTKDGFFLTDIIVGDNVTIYLFEPSAKKNQSKLTIKKVVHGYKSVFNPESNKLKALGCHNEIACYPDWSVESDAVALILLSNGGTLCTGSMLMDANQSFKSYFLTAFHCVDLSEPYGSLSATEIANSERWMFRFQFKRTSCENGTVPTGISYNGAAFRAAWNQTDFALMELNANVVGDSRFTWLGWDRTANISANGTTIHHPAGATMKISFDNHRLISDNNSKTWANGTSTPPNTHWIVGLDNGTTEGGSSGAPLFNSNKRVIGQIHGGQGGCAPINDWHGRFDKSWTGGGTNNTRLSNWLDPNNSGAMTTNSTKRGATISGPEFVCEEGIYSISGYNIANVVWSLENISSKSGAEPRIVPLDDPLKCKVYNQYQYPAILNLSATVTLLSGATFTISKRIESDQKSPDLSGKFEQEACTFQGVSHPKISGDMREYRGKTLFFHQGCLVTFSFVGRNNRTIKLSTANGGKPDYWDWDKVNGILRFRLPLSSGGTPFKFYFGEEGQCSEKPLIVFSVSNNGNITLKTKSTSVSADGYAKVKVYELSSGNMVYSDKKVILDSFNIDNLDLKKGFYILEIETDEEVIRDKVYKK